jgi:dTDP-4-dehydrorhamnose 3,5-epimerase
MKIDGVKLIDLKAHPDTRGSYTEMYHDDWSDAPKHLPQWSVVHSRTGAIRGMRIHLEHSDYVCLCQGQALYVTKDLRQDSPTFGEVEYYELSSDKLQIIITPPGVAHGFYFRTDAIFVVGITHPYDPADELGFYYADPEANIAWPKDAPHIVSDRDAASPSLKEVLPLMPKWEKSL